MQHPEPPLRLRRILALVDTRALFTRANAYQCLDRIARLAMEHGAAVTLCDVLEPPPPETASQAVAGRLHELRARFARESLERLAEPVRDLLPIGVEIHTGTPFLSVTRQVLRERYDLVVHVTASGSGHGLGADDMHLARKCPCPVWIMDADGAARYRHIVVAVDRDIFANTENASTFALQLSQTALMFGRLEGARVTIVHAWEPFGAELLSDPRAQIDSRTVTRYVEEQRANHATWLARLAAAVAAAEGGAVPPAALATELLEGAAVSAVADYVERSAADLLVMGTVGVTTVPGLFIGNTAESILGRIRVPVLALKPPGFDSPIRAVPDPAQGAAADAASALESE